MLPTLACTLASALLMVTTLQPQPQPESTLPKATRPEVYAPHAMAATSQPLATQAALDVMRAGGSAVDGAIAANACLGLMEPTGSGVGGDTFAIVWDPKAGKLLGYNGSGRAPAAISIDLIKSKGLDAIPPLGPLPVTVPGAVDGWCALHDRFGRLPLKDDLAPAIGYCENGFPLSPVIAEAWGISAKRLVEFPGFKEQFTTDGRAPRAGELWKNPNLARTYRRIAELGRDGFYTGEIPRIVEAYMKAQGGVLGASDFAAHRGEWVEPVSATYRGYEVWELPPNGQGIAALQILKILEGYDLKSMGWGSADYVHTFVEAKKLAFEDRARFYADPKFSKTPVHTLIGAEYAAKRRSLIDPVRAAKAFDPGSIPNGADTVYFTVADSDGMMVSMIQSNFRGMGSGMTPYDPASNAKDTGLGFILQDRGEQFALVPDHPNALVGGKRPFHTIIPSFITKDGKPWISFGVMGGDMQPQGHAQIVVNLIDFGMTLQQAGDAPRIHHDGSTEPAGMVKPMADGGTVHLDAFNGGFPQATVDELKRRGHTIKSIHPWTYGGYQAIMRDPVTGVYCGASESRKDGHAAGY
jgi:gamma-glutamyltranspeptidase/glutathione hydrolase